MASAEASVVGFAKQSSLGTPNTNDNDFTYVLFQEGAFGPQNQTLPLDAEVGGGALPRGMVKTGVVSGGALRMIPRPDSLGLFVYGATGSVATEPHDTLPDFYVHTFRLGSDQFAAPYFTARNAPGSLWGEQYQDCRFNAVSLEFRGADFLRATVGVSGGMPERVSIATWNALQKVDGGPQFIAPKSAIELPTGTSAKVIQGSFAAGINIPLDEQWIVGSYSPDAFDVVSRQFVLTLAVKIADPTLYSKMMYDPAEGNQWTADIFREARIKLNFKSDVAGYELDVAANGQSGADANVIWSAQPVAMRAGRQLVMAVTGLFTASPDPVANPDPITVTLTNKRESY